MPSWPAFSARTAGDSSWAIRAWSSWACWASVTFSCCSWVIWYDPVSRMVLISSRQSRPPPSSPTTRKTNGVREDRATPAVAVLGPRRTALTGAGGRPDGRGWAGGRGRPAGRGGAAGRGRGGAGRPAARPRAGAAALPGREPVRARPWLRLVSVTTSVCPLTMSPSRHSPPRGRSGDGPACGPGAPRSRGVPDAFGGPEPGRGGSRVGGDFRAGWPLRPPGKQPELRACLGERHRQPGRRGVHRAGGQRTLDGPVLQRVVRQDDDPAAHGERVQRRGQRPGQHVQLRVHLDPQRLEGPFGGMSPAAAGRGGDRVADDL